MRYTKVPEKQELPAERYPVLGWRFHDLYCPGNTRYKVIEVQSHLAVKYTMEFSKYGINHMGSKVEKIRSVISESIRSKRSSTTRS